MEEEKRHLAHIEKIVAIRPIEGADNIEVAQILGWECVVQKKDNFKVGQLAIYVEVDSIMPDKPEFEFLRARKFRIKTIKLRRQISQGLLLPLTAAFQVTATHVEEGQDVTELLGVSHYDPESSLNQNQSEYIPQSKFLKFLLKYWICRKLILPFLRKKKEAWPQYISRTDEQRIQNIPRTLEIHKDKEFYVTEKIDYQSATFFSRNVKDGLFTKRIFGVCSRNRWLKKEDTSLYWKIARKYNLEEILLNHPDELTIQGEQGDVSVQKNKYGLTGPRFWVFNIINNRTKKHFSLEEMEDFCAKYNLEMVPLLERKFKLPSTVEEVVKFSIGKSVLAENVEREGVVVRNIEDGQKISFKCISPVFLLKHDQ